MSRVPVEPPKLFIREWMEKAKLSQRQLAERLDCGSGTISKLLNGQMEMTQTWLAAIAFSIGINALDLYRNPSSRDLASEIQKLPPDQQDEALRFIEYLKSKR